MNQAGKLNVLVVAGILDGLERRSLVREVLAASKCVDGKCVCESDYAGADCRSAKRLLGKGACSGAQITNAFAKMVTLAMTAEYLVLMTTLAMVLDGKTG